MCSLDMETRPKKNEFVACASFSRTSDAMVHPARWQRESLSNTSRGMQTDEPINIVFVLDVRPREQERFHSRTINYLLPKDREIIHRPLLMTRATGGYLYVTQRKDVNI